MSRLLTLLASAWLALPPAQGLAALGEVERARASELFAEYQTALASGDRDSATNAIQALIDELPPEAAAVTHAQIIEDVKSKIEIYRTMAEAMLAGEDARGRLRDPEVRQHRDTIADILKVADEGIQKRRLAEEGWPALTRLQELLLPDPLGRITSDRTLARGRDQIQFLLTLCDGLARHARLPQDAALKDQLTDFDLTGADLESIATSSDKRILEENRRIAEKAGVPAADVQGIEDANRIRVLAGFPALQLDPLLCKASLNHSTDMAEQGFFAHESPVRGRTTFTDRAREVNTTASAENIAMGQATGAEANRGWFLSPGHFRNFFGDHARIGLGSYNRHWTQMFGR